MTDAMIIGLQVFSEVMTRLYEHKLPKTGEHSPMISKETYDIIMANSEVSFELQTRDWMLLFAEAQLCHSLR